MAVINGKHEKEADGKILLVYLEEKGYRPEIVAVECGGKIVQKSTYGQKVIEDGDIIEIVSFVGGG